jgi:hypothetical protein
MTTTSPGAISISKHLSWTVDAGDQSLYKYKIDDDRMTVAWSILRSSVGGGSSLIKLKVPGGKIPTEGELTFEIQDGGDRWQQVAYDEDNFAGSPGSSSMAWTVSSTDQQALMYALDGNQMTVAWVIWTSSTNVAAPYLRLKIPADKLPARHAVTDAAVIVDTAWYMGVAHVGYIDDDPYITIMRMGGLDIPSSSDQLRTEGQITFEIQEEE